MRAVAASLKPMQLSKHKGILRMLQLCHDVRVNGHRQPRPKFVCRSNRVTQSHSKHNGILGMLQLSEREVNIQMQAMSHEQHRCAPVIWVWAGRYDARLTAPRNGRLSFMLCILFNLGIRHRICSLCCPDTSEQLPPQQNLKRIPNRAYDVKGSCHSLIGGPSGQLALPLSPAIVLATCKWLRSAQNSESSNYLM